MLSVFFQVAVTAATVSAAPGDTLAALRGPTAPGPGLEVVRYDGSRAQTDVATPAVESAGIDVDGMLDEPVWEQGRAPRGLHAVRPDRRLAGLAADRGLRAGRRRRHLLSG